jgi:pantetheine-phosphate adenylyltransferase
MVHNPRVGLYPGSFDPITVGHEDIIRRALSLCDRLIIAVSTTSSDTKRGMFDVPERLSMVQEIFAGDDRIEVIEFQGLLVDLARQRGATVVVRGVRGVRDFEYELQMAMMNREMNPEVETVFLAPSADRAFVSSTLVREIAGLGGDVSSFVSLPVLRRLERPGGTGA